MSQKVQQGQLQPGALCGPSCSRAHVLCVPWAPGSVLIAGMFELWLKVVEAMGGLCLGLYPPGRPSEGFQLHPAGRAALSVGVTVG